MVVNIETKEPIKCTVQDIEDAIMSGESFGIIKCDIHVPKELLSHFREYL